MHFDGRQPTLDASDLNQGSSSLSASSSRQAPSSSRTSRQTQATTSSLLEELNSISANTSEIRPINSQHPTYRVQDGTALSILQTILFYPFALSYKVVNSIFYFLSSIFPFLPRITGYYPANRTATHSVQKVYDPKDTAARVIRAFEETYGQTGLKFYEGGFAQAFDEAKQNLKFLIAILQSDEHDLTGPFNRQVLTDPRVVEFLNKENTIVWLGNVENSEGFQIAESLKCTTFPFTILVAPFPKTPNSSVVVLKSLVTIQGAESDPMHFISTLEEKIETHSPILATLIYDKEERELDRRLREQQNAAYERSLAVDRERARVAREEKLQRELQEKERKAKEEEEKRQAALLKEKEHAWKLWKIGKLGPEFTSSSPDQRAARISIRTLEGTRLVRKFSGEDTIEDIYSYVECHKLLETIDNAELVKIYKTPELYPKPEGYTHEYKFKLASSMPRKVIEPDSKKLIKSEKAIWPSGSLVVEVEFPSDEEEDDDDSDNDNDDE